MSESVTVELPSNLTIATVEALHEQLEPFAKGSEDVVLNAAEVTRADTAGLQTLLAFAKELEKSGIHIVWQSPSKVLLDAANQLGLAQGLSLQ